MADRDMALDADVPVPVVPCAIMQSMCSGMDNVTGIMFTNVTSNATLDDSDKWLTPWQVSWVIHDLILVQILSFEVGLHNCSFFTSYF